MVSFNSNPESRGLKHRGGTHYIPASAVMKVDGLLWDGDKLWFPLAPNTIPLMICLGRPSPEDN